MANYVIQHIFVDSGSSMDVLFYKVSQQMELGDILLEPMDTSLYGFVGEVVHPLGQILLPLSLGMEPTKRTKIVCFVVVDMPSAYSLILGRPTLNTFQAVISTCHIKLKFPIGDNVGEIKGDQYMARKCYVEARKSSINEMKVDLPSKENSKNSIRHDDQKGAIPAHVQPAKQLLSIQLVFGEPNKITKIGSQDPILAGQLTIFLQQNVDVFAWTTNDLVGIDPSIEYRSEFPPVKQKKRYFGP
ncbi:UNVERIFIED_CONTAM: hypothetical protein Sradi_5849100 [Sesamum radiatum]|uniref:Uncharacterized protein n=1 Tax=Sesamum radiatum TaxID=300843 RepID=A0AAW2KU57_SESRA